MTAILNEMRQLDARLKRGDIDAAEYARLRARMRHSIEEAHPVIIDGKATSVAQPSGTGASNITGKPDSGMSWGFGLVICFGIITLCMGLALMLLVDISFGLTLGVTVLAALTVALFRNLEE